MGARWEDPRHARLSDRPSILDRVFPDLGAPASGPDVEARRQAMIAHPASGDAVSPVSAGGAPRPAHGPTSCAPRDGRGAHHRLDGIRRPSRPGSAAPISRRAPHSRHPEPAEDGWGIAIGLTVALLGLVFLLGWCTGDPASSLWCAEKSCEVQP